jgi:hypothetical protein
VSLHGSLGNRAAGESKRPATEHDNDGSSTSQRHATCCHVFAAGLSCAASLRHIALQFCTLFLDANQEEALCACALTRYASEAHPNAKNVCIRSRNGTGKYVKQTHTHIVRSPSSRVGFKKSSQFTPLSSAILRNRFEANSKQTKTDLEHSRPKQATSNNTARLHQRT